MLKIFNDDVDVTEDETLIPGKPTRRFLNSAKSSEEGEDEGDGDTAEVIKGKTKNMGYGQW